MKNEMAGALLVAVIAIVGVVLFVSRSDNDDAKEIKTSAKQEKLKAIARSMRRDQMRKLNRNMFSKKSHITENNSCAAEVSGLCCGV